MSRWRPPAEKSSPYITPQGYQKLEQELSGLWQKRRIVNDALSEAAKEGDRSENAEYIYRKKEQAEIDRRIRYLQKRMPDLNIIDKVANKDQVFFGANVSLTDEMGTIRQYRIVGADEVDTSQGEISLDSPLAKAMLKKSVYEEISLKVGKEPQRIYVITDIQYD